jgi:hypothetical protein
MNILLDKNRRAVTDLEGNPIDVSADFCICTVVEGVHLPWPHRDTLDSFIGSLSDPEDLSALIGIIEWGKKQGVELYFSIDD